MVYGIWYMVARISNNHCVLIMSKQSRQRNAALLLHSFCVSMFSHCIKNSTSGVFAVIVDPCSVSVVEIAPK